MKNHLRLFALLLLLVSLYDHELLAQGTWVTKAQIPEAVSNANAAVIGQTIYLVGGSNGDETSFLQAYDVPTDAWSSRASLPSPCYCAGVAAIGDKLYYVAGANNQTYYREVRIYDAVADSWSSGAEMNESARFCPGATRLGGLVYLAGGSDASGLPLSTMEVYDPVTNTWTDKASMSVARGNLSLVELNGKLYAIGGGTASGALNILEEYDPGLNSWTTKAPMQTARQHFAAAALNERIYVIGGEVTNPTGVIGTVEEYDPATDAWRTLTPDPVLRGGATAVAVNGAIYVEGGSTSPGPATFFQTNEQFTPPPSCEYAPDANTVLLLHMNELSGSFVADASGNGNGTATGTSIVDGMFGNARQFGTVADEIRVGNPFSGVQDNFTIEAWINVNQLNANSAHSSNTVFRNRQHVFDVFLVLANDGRLNANIHNNTASNHLFSNAAILLHRWYHIAFTYDAQTMKLYINGQLDTSRVIGALNHDWTLNYIGTSIGNNTFDGADWAFNGIIDELRISNKARTPNELNAGGTVAGRVISSGNGLAGVTVKLLDINSMPVPGFDPILTNSSGDYAFASVPSGNYQVMIVEPLGYTAASNPRSITIEECRSITADFFLTELVVSNTARSKGYWKHQFDVYVTGRGQAQETQAQLNEYIASIHAHYTPHFDVFAGKTSFADWQTLLSSNAHSSMLERAKEQLAALVLNLASLKIGQYMVITVDGRNAGNVLTYVSSLLTDANTSNDELGKNLAEKINTQQPIVAGLVPAGNILYKGLTRSITWGFNKPLEFGLSNNYPNPFNPTTSIHFELPEDAHVRIAVYNTLGQHVATLVDAMQTAGYHSVDFDASALSSGVYFYRLDAAGTSSSKKEFHQVKKMILIR